MFWRIGRDQAISNLALCNCRNGLRQIPSAGQAGNMASRAGDFFVDGREFRNLAGNPSHALQRLGDYRCHRVARIVIVHS
jgi:hypothetical protein